jgi:hypothetical protein
MRQDAEGYGSPAIQAEIWPMMVPFRTLLTIWGGWMIADAVLAYFGWKGWAGLSGLREDASIGFFLLWTWVFMRLTSEKTIP